MSNQETGVLGKSAVDNNMDMAGDQTVANYLRRHPGFFEDNPTLLADLRLPHNTGSAVSLVERQVAVLRDGSESLKEQLDSLIQIARENDQLGAHLHKLTLSLIESKDLESQLNIIVNHLRRDFTADLVVVRLLVPPADVAFASRPEFIGDADAFCGSFQHLLSAGKPYCGRLKSGQLDLLFDDNAQSVGSTAILPLGTRGGLGLLAIGSYEQNHFQAGTDTAFLGRMAEIITMVLQQHLNAD